MFGGATAQHGMHLLTSSAWPVAYTRAVLPLPTPPSHAAPPPRHAPPMRTRNILAPRALSPDTPQQLARLRHHLGPNQAAVPQRLISGRVGQSALVVYKHHVPNLPQAGQQHVVLVCNGGGGGLRGLGMREPDGGEEGRDGGTGRGTGKACTGHCSCTWHRLPVCRPPTCAALPHGHQLRRRLPQVEGGHRQGSRVHVQLVDPAQPAPARAAGRSSRGACKRVGRVRQGRYMGAADACSPAIARWGVQGGRTGGVTRWGPTGAARQTCVRKPASPQCLHTQALLACDRPPPHLLLRSPQLSSHRVITSLFTS